MATCAVGLSPSVTGPLLATGTVPVAMTSSAVVADSMSVAVSCLMLLVSVPTAFAVGSACWLVSDTLVSSLSVTVSVVSLLTSAVST